MELENPREWKTAHNSIMEQKLFKFLPADLTLDILSRLPAPDAMSCKLVCKPWLYLIKTPGFAKSHLSKQASGLVVFKEGDHPKPYKIFEFVDVRSGHPWNAIFNFNLPCKEPPYSSADGLLFLCTPGMVSIRRVAYRVEWPRNLFICNPVTCECIKLPCPPESSISEPQVQMDTFGFGLSSISGQYKLVRIFHEWKSENLPVLTERGPSKCQVYTVGTGSWGRVSFAGPYKYEGNAKGAFLNGNLHWMVRQCGVAAVWISCFNLETEVFSTFTTPPCHYNLEECLNVSALNGCLCLCDNSADDEIVIWLMKEYGVEESWMKEFVIAKNNINYEGLLIWPIKAFKNGDILLALESCNKLLHYSRSTQTISHVDPFGSTSDFCIHTTSYTPSFLPLKTYALENVTSFSFQTIV